MMFLDGDRVDGGGGGVDEALLDAVVGLDGDRMAELMRDVHDRCGGDVLVSDVLVPLLRTIGEWWSAGRLSVMHEHHASAMIRSVVADLPRPSVGDDASRVVLACPPGELHELPLHLFAVMLADRGIRPIVLGANTPVVTVRRAVQSTGARACVVAVRRERSMLAHGSSLTMVNRIAPVLVAGPAASSQACTELGLHPLSHDWRTAADRTSTIALSAHQSPTDVSSSTTPGTPRRTWTTGVIDADLRRLSP